MAELLTIARFELLRWLRRPSYWLLLAGLTFVLAFLFLRFVEGFEAVRAANLAGAARLSMSRAIMQPWMAQAGIVLMLLTPLLTMRAIAGERRDRTWPLLRGAGLTPTQIVLGKLLGALLTLGGPLLVTALIPLTLALFGTLDAGQWFSAMLGIVLLVTASTAAGIFFSAVVDEPVNAALLHYGLLLLLMLFHVTSTMPGVLAPGLYWLSPFSHFLPFVEARFSSAHLLWFLLLAAIFLWLAIRRIGAEYAGIGARRRRIAAATVTLLGMAAFLLAGIAAQRFDISADLSQARINSLSPAAARLVEKMTQPLQIHAIVADSPPLRRKIEQALAPWLDASARISLHFATPEENAAASAGRLNQQGRLLLRYGQKEETLTTLGEATLLRALQRLIEGREQWIVFLEGHGEKSLYDRANGGYSTLDRLLRERGLHTQAINLLKLPAIPDNATLLVLAGPTEEMLEGELTAIASFVARGGNLLLLRDPDAAEGIDRLLADVGVTALPGIVIDANDRLRKLLAIRHPAVIPVTDFAATPFAVGNGTRLLLPLASALTSSDDSGWNHLPLLRSNVDSWNETGDLRGHVRFDAGGDERPGPLALGIIAQRTHRDQPQRAVAIGDSDFLDNEYIGLVDNAAFALGLFDWLTTGADASSDAKAPPRIEADIDDRLLLPIAAALLLGLPLIFLGIALWRWRGTRRSHARTA